MVWGRKASVSLIQLVTLRIWVEVNSLAGLVHSRHFEKWPVAYTRTYVRWHTPKQLGFEGLYVM